MDNLKQDLISYFYKWWALLLYIMIGLVGKFSYDVMKGKKISIGQAFSGIGLGLFCGFIASSICISNGWEKPAMVIVPMATLLSEKLTIAIFAIDWKKIAHDWAAYWADKWK